MRIPRCGLASRTRTRKRPEEDDEAEEDDDGVVCSTESVDVSRCFSAKKTTSALA